MGPGSNVLLWMLLGLRDFFDLSGHVIECVLLSGLFSATDMAPLAGMVIREPGPNLPQRARSLEDVSGSTDPEYFDHVPIRIMPSSQLGAFGVYRAARSGADQQRATIVLVPREHCPHAARNLVRQRHRNHRQRLSLQHPCQP